MADESPLDLEKMATADETELKAALDKLKADSTPPPAPVPDPIQTSLETPKDDEVKPVETKPAEEKKPDEVKPEEQKPDGTAWKLLRQKERELADLKRAMAERDKPAVETKPKEPTYEDDPAEFLRRKSENTEAELARLRAKQTQDEAMENIRSQERDFQSKQPDYPDALKYIETAEVNEWQKSGMAAADIRDLRQTVSRGKSGDTRFKPYSDHVERIASRPDVVQLAEKQNQDPEDVATFLVARDTYLTSRRQLVWRAAEATGNNPAAIAYELAKGRGYLQTPAEKAATDAAEAARARVAQAKEVSKAAESLSEVTTESGPTPKVIRNRNQVLQLNDDELDAMIKSGSFKELQ